jgi:shikimate dehydrogenase
MIRLGLIGYPLGHSLSPVIHRAALSSCGLEGSYSLFPVPPEEGRGLEKLLGEVRSGGITGLNVTIPHKQAVIEFLDRLTPRARTIGAVNTIYLRENELIGDNTDAPGFLSDLKRFLSTAGHLDTDQQALVLGAGGSARAVVYALLSDGWQVTIAARRMEQAEQLAASMGDDQVKTTDLMFSNLEISRVSLVVNTTPVGMTPQTNQSPWPLHIPFPPDAAIYDLVYNPEETRLVREARQAALPATTGIGMLIEQAALAFEIWTGQRLKRQILLDAIRSTAH